MQVALHNILAECPACHGTDFEPHGVARELIASHTPMACTRCGAQTNYLTLLTQIGDTAIARSVETLDRIRSQNAQLRSKLKPPTKE